ncbi:hypothetical protein NDU88_005988 [Pleurodeles waltl]|uniref:Uncharacterized protein n=1 Tax=Pleurodeles waltl TaxID=8319 RepID=A0AAV7SNA8_PLEWA|nr:hypothetical protein NDU88_005988 [Pleurodeles waltl]
MSWLRPPQCPPPCLLLQNSPKIRALPRYQALGTPSQEPYFPKGESSPSLFAPGRAPAWHAPSAGVSHRMPLPVSEAAGFPKFERPACTSSRSLCVQATPPGTAERASSELRPRRHPPCPPEQPQSHFEEFFGVVGFSVNVVHDGCSFGLLDVIVHYIIEQPFEKTEKYFAAFIKVRLFKNPILKQVVR